MSTYTDLISTALRSTATKDSKVTQSAVILITEKDWYPWLELTTTSAEKFGLWKYINPAIKEENIPKLVAPKPPTTPIAFSDLKPVEQIQLKLLQLLYLDDLRSYQRQVEAMAELRATIQNTIHRDNFRYTRNCPTVWHIMVILRDRFAPTERCEECRLLHTGSWKHSWAIAVVRLDVQRWKCRTCKLIYDGISALLGPAFIAVFNSVMFPERHEEDDGTLRVDIHPPTHSQICNSVKVCRLRIYTAPGAEIPWKFIGQAPHIDRKCLSETSLTAIKGWLGSCLKGDGRHVNCVTETNTVLPKRVILIDPVETSYVKLYVPSKGETGRYVALSHCWGGSTPIMTTKNNLDKIPIPLPKTFDDAVVTTRALGVRNLWIDSLCITQDSPEDWSEQAPRMASIYGNAYVVIAADAAADSSQGFLDHPNRQFNRAVPIPYKGMTKGNEIWIRERGSLGYQLAFHGWTEKALLPSAYELGQELKMRAEGKFRVAGGIDNSPFWPSHLLPSMGQIPSGEILASVFTKNGVDKVMDTLGKVCRERRCVTSKLSTRGWVFQERALSPRTLHFGEFEIGWECFSIISCECSATSQRYRRTESLLKQARTKMPWADVVTEYTRMGLTVAEDRLAALAGLASVRSESMKSQRYVAGMWERDLTDHIAWYVENTGDGGELLKHYIAPTWSWASITGPVSYHNQTSYVSHFKVLSINCQPRGTSLFGDCTEGAYIVITGLLVPVAVDFDSWSIKASAAKISGKTKGRRARAIRAAKQPSILFDTTARKYAVKQARGQESFAFFIVNKGPEMPHGLLLMTRNSKDPQPDRGLLSKIQPSVPRVSLKYERVGYIFTKKYIKSPRRWSRNLYRNHSSSSSEEDIPNDSIARQYWEPFASIQAFALY